jgi:hypothetical protein
MATPVFTPDFTIISDCDTIGTWTTNSAALDADIKKQGNFAIGGTCTNPKPTNYYTPASPIDIRGSHLRLWFISVLAANMDLQSNGGLQLMVSDGVNTGYWNVLGSDTYEGGWVLIVQDVQEPVDAGTKPDLSVISELGFRYNFASSPKNFQNTWFDYFVHGSGYSLTGGTANDPITWDDIATADADYSNGYGVVQKYNGVYFVTGGIEFSGAYFKDAGATVVYVSNPVSADYYRLTTAGSGYLQMGNTVGGRGVQGCSINCPSGYPVHVDFTNEEIDVLKIYGSVFRNVAEILCPSGSTNREFVSTSFEECSGVLVHTFKFRYCNWINADDLGAIIESNNHDVAYSNFINCGHGVYFPNSGTYDFNNLIFAGSDGVTKYDIENASSGLVIINATDSNPSYVDNTGPGSSTEIKNSVNITITVKDSNNQPIANASVAVYNDATRAQLMNEYTTALGIATESYNYLGDITLDIRVRKSSTGSIRY